MPATILCGQAHEHLENVDPFDVLITHGPWPASHIAARQPSGWAESVELGYSSAIESVKDDGTIILICTSAGDAVRWFTELLHPWSVTRFLSWTHNRALNLVLICKKPGSVPTKVRPQARITSGEGPLQLQLQTWNPRLGLPYDDLSRVTSTDVPKMKSLGGHPSTVPLIVAQWLLQPILLQHHRGNLRLLDPFCGSGALLEPAFRSGHDVIGIDINSKWVDLARNVRFKAP